MTQREPDGPYVYQPFGSVNHPEHDKAGRLWGVGGVHVLATIHGLTKPEAAAVVKTLRDLWATGVGIAPSVGHE